VEARHCRTHSSGAEDDFIYTALSDTSITAALRDIITDFEPGINKIDLSGIDAITTNAAGTNDAFNFIEINLQFNGYAGETATLGPISQLS
jgi:hypothetical protein